MWWILVACAKHADQPAPTSDALPFDEAVAQGTLDNGLAWFVERAEYPAGRAELRLVVDAGAALETPEQYGAAHILEHLAFQGGAHFGPDELVAFMESVGMRFGPDAIRIFSDRFALAECTVHPKWNVASPAFMCEGPSIGKLIRSR